MSREEGSVVLSRLYLEGPLHAPLNRELSQRVQTLLNGGGRAIVLDLTNVPSIDAAGVGELVRAYNMAIAANGVLQTVHATAWVREILERAGLFDLLSAGAHADVVATQASLTGVFAGEHRV